MSTMIGAGFSSAGKYRPDSSCPSDASKKTSIGSGGRTTIGVEVGGISVGVGVLEGVVVEVGVGDAGISVACLVSSGSLGSVATTLVCSDPQPARIRNTPIVIIRYERVFLRMDKLYNICCFGLFENFSLLFTVPRFHNHLDCSYF